MKTSFSIPFNITLVHSRTNSISELIKSNQVITVNLSICYSKYLSNRSADKNTYCSWLYQLTNYLKQ